MKPDKLTVIVCALCMAAVITTLYARNFIYPAVSLPSATETVVPGSDPYDGGSITIHYHERHPYYSPQGKGVGGIIGDRITFVFNQAKIPLAWQMTPAGHQLEIIKKNERREGAAGWFRTPVRESFSKFSWPIYQDQPTIALARADRESIRSGGMLADTLAHRRLSLLRKDGYSYGQHIDDLIDQLQPNQMVTTAENTGMLKIIHIGRADYFFISEEEADDLLSRSGLPASVFKKVFFADMPEGNRRYILFSRRVEATTIERLNRHIRNYGVGLPENGSTPK